MESSETTNNANINLHSKLTVSGTKYRYAHEVICSITNFADGSKRMALEILTFTEQSCNGYVYLRNQELWL